MRIAGGDQTREVREFWFGRLPLTAGRLAERMAFWFGAGESQSDRSRRDEALRARFEPLAVEAAKGKLDSWAGSPRRLLSLIILLDQLPRNLYRGTPRAFATDQQALGLTVSGIHSGADAALAVVERIFFYMPLQHAELLDAQEESVAVYHRLLDESPEELRPSLRNVLRHAEAHRSIIRRFGRFPHRNGILGRPSTPEEQGYLSSAREAFEQS